MHLPRSISILFFAVLFFFFGRLVCSLHVCLFARLSKSCTHLNQPIQSYPVFYRTTFFLVSICFRLSIYLFVYLFVHVSTYPFVLLSISPSIHIHPSLYPFVHFSIHQSIHLIYLCPIFSICLSEVSFKSRFGPKRKQFCEISAKMEVDNLNTLRNILNATRSTTSKKNNFARQTVNMESVFLCCYTFCWKQSVYDEWMRPRHTKFRTCHANLKIWCSQTQLL